MSEANFDLDSADKRRTLCIVLWLNVGIAVGFFITGYFGDSSALIANGIDNSTVRLTFEAVSKGWLTPS